MIRKNINKLIFIASIICFLLINIIEDIQTNKYEDNIRGLNINEINKLGYNYLEIPRLNIRNIIVKGMNQDNLDKNYVTTDDNIKTNTNITLAGHSIKNVFGKLHQIEIGDEIYINTIYHYKVIKIKTINEDEINKLSKKKNTLNLITCKINPKKRLLVIAQMTKT